jgi:general secretion pathway protein N
MNNWRLVMMIAALPVLGGSWWFDRGWRGEPEEVLPNAVAAMAPETGQADRPRLTRLAAVNPLADWPADALAEVLDRPLFNPSRRPFKPPPVIAPPPPLPAPEPVPEPLDITLTGVLLSKSGRLALLKENGSGKMLRLKEGQSFEEWTLEAVGLREVVLTGRGEHLTLRLFEDRSGGEGKRISTAEFYSGEDEAKDAAAVKRTRREILRKMADERRRRLQRTQQRRR